MRWLARAQWLPALCPHTLLPWAIPARIVGYVGTGEAASAAAPDSVAVAQSVGVGGVSLHELPLIPNAGSLSFGEFARSVPFEPKRYFLVFDVPSQRSGVSTPTTSATSS